MNNIFEGAKFGDKYLTRSGIVMLYINFTSDVRHKLTMDGMKVYYYDSNGRLEEDYETHLDIVSRYQEQIDEEKLDELAHNHCMNSGYSGIDDNDYINDETLTWGDIMKDIKRAYKSGYLKAMEE